MILGHDFYFPKRVVLPILECTDRKVKRKQGKKREKTESENMDATASVRQGIQAQYRWKRSRVKSPRAKDSSVFIDIRSSCLKAAGIQMGQVSRAHRNSSASRKWRGKSVPCASSLWRT